MAKQFNLPKVQTFKPTKQTHSTGGFGGGEGGGDVTNNYYTAAGINYVFSPDTDPATGAIGALFCFDNTSVGAATKCYVSILGNDSENWTKFLKLVTSGTLSIYWMNGSASMVTAFAITRMVETLNYFEFDVTHVGGQLPTGNCYLGFVADAPGVRQWVAMLSQDGSAADPTIVILKNSLGTDVSYERSNTGIYQPVLSVPAYFTSITPAAEIASNTLVTNGSFGVAIMDASLTISTQDVDVPGGTVTLSDGMLNNTLVRISHT
jgi:hypothetical protein